MQSKNLIVFFLSSVVVIAGYVALMNALYPPKAKKNDAQAKVDEKAKKNEAPDGKEDALPEKKGAEVKKDPPEEKKPVVEEKKKTPERETRTFVLGDDASHLRVELTTRGGAVQQVVLNRFKTADYLGRPVDRPLELVPADPIQPSFRMYHYGELGAKAEPILGLGEENWEHVGEPAKEDGLYAMQFRATLPGKDFIEIRKTYRLHPKEYHVRMELEFRDTRKAGDAKAEFRYQLTGATGLPIEGEWYATTFRNALIGLVDSSGSLWRTLEDSHRVSTKDGGEAVPDRALGRGSDFLQYAAVANQFFASAIVVDDQQAAGVDRKGILSWARATNETTQMTGRIGETLGDVLVFLDGRTGLPEPYVLLPRVKQHLQDAKFKTGEKAVLSFYVAPDGRRVATWIRKGSVPRPMMDDLTVRANSDAISLLPGEAVQHRFLLYHGPVKTKLLAQFRGDAAVDPALVDRYATGLHLRTLIDYRGDNSISKFLQFVKWTDLLIAVTSLMHILLDYLHVVTLGNYGLSIFLLTVVVRGMMFPISRRQAMLSVKMQELKPEIAKLREKHKQDKLAQQQAMMALYRKHNVHPIGGCLPVLMQMPIFLGLYYAFQESIHFRLASFLWIPNLAAPDMLAWWSENIPVISDPDNYGGFLSIFYLGPYFNLLPCIAMVLMIAQQKMLTPPATNEEEEMQQKMMQYMMVFFGVMFFKVASGLCIYFIASSLWGLAERKLLPKKKLEPAFASNGDAPASPFKSQANPKKGKQKGAIEEEPGLLDRLKAWWKNVLEQAEKK